MSESELYGKLVVVDRDHPNRCQSLDEYNNHCPALAVEGSLYCKNHGGNKAIERFKKDSIRQYHLGEMQRRVNEFADSTQIKQLREEIAISRCMLEKLLLKCQDFENISMTMLMIPRVQSLIETIRQLIVTADKLDTKLDIYIDKSSILTLASKMVEIISEYVTSENQLEVICERINNLVTEQKVGSFKTPIS